MVGSLSIIGAICDFYRRKNHIVKFNIIPHPKPKLISFNNRPLFTIKNNSGKDIHLIRVTRIISKISKIEDKQMKTPNDGVVASIMINTHKDYTLTYSKRRVDILGCYDLYMLIKKYFESVNFGRYIVDVNFICSTDNYSEQCFQIVYDYQKTFGKSTVIKIMRIY